MKEYEVTVLFEGKLEKWVCYSTSVSRVKKYITNYWAREFIAAKIIKVIPIK
jgi:hypothetical protein